jgi:polysaccharide pyruvyl transferase WcaK-like protein
MNIGVFGHYGNKNLGDEAIIQAVIQNIRQRAPSAQIIGFSIKPEDTTARYGIESYPIRKLHPATSQNDSNDDTSPQRNSESSETTDCSAKQNDIIAKVKKNIKGLPLVYQLGKAVLRSGSFMVNLFEEGSFLCLSYKRLKTIDILMVTGSNQFLDNFGGPWGFPYTLLKWSILSKMTGTKLHFLCVGAGPINLKLSKVFIRWALGFADYVSLRDVSSEKLIKEIGYKGKTFVYPDLAYSLSVDHITPTKLPDCLSNKTFPIIGINPMPVYDSRYWCESDNAKYNKYIEKMVEFTSRLLDNEYPFFFFPTQEKDTNVINDILDAIQKNRNITNIDNYILQNNTVDELISNLMAFDATLATRFHGTVLSFHTDKPMLGICYYRKSSELMSEMGQGSYALDLDSFTADDLWVRFETLLANFVKEKQKIEHKNREYQALLDVQYNKILE